MVALLAPELGLEEALRALRVALATGQLPTLRTLDALVPARSAASVAAQVALGAGAPVAVVAARGNSRFV